jgi:hypothetical protein
VYTKLKIGKGKDQAHFFTLGKCYKSKSETPDILGVQNNATPGLNEKLDVYSSTS